MATLSDNSEPGDYSTCEVAANRPSATVLQVLPALEAGGVERGTLEIAEALVAAGWRALVASAGGRMVADLEALGGRHFILPLAGKSPWLIYRNIARLAQVIEAEGVDLVHVRSRAPAWSARAAARGTGRPFVTTYHSPYGDAWWKRPYNAVMASGDRVIAISDFVADIIRQRHDVKPDHLIRIHRGVDLRTFDPDKVPAAALDDLTAIWSLPSDAPVVLLPGRLTRWKGQTLAIEALARMARQDTVLVLLGSDQGRTEYRQELAELAARLGIADRVRLPGGYRDMPAAYQRADVVLSASTEPEGFGRVAAEGLAMAKPVVASDHGGSLEIVTDGETGRLFASGDADALAQALDEMLDLTPTAAAALGASARRRAAAHFSTARMCADTLSVYRDLLPGRV